MKNYLTKSISKALTLLGIVMFFFPIDTRGEDVTATFINIQMKSGAVESVMLSNAVDFIAPRINRGERKILVNGQTFSSDDVEAITFEKRIVDGIEDVKMAGNDRQMPEGVFDLQGRRVMDASDGLLLNNSMLPKGIYVVNGKKVVVK